MVIARDNGSPVEEVVIARVVKPRGIRGEVACEIETDFPERFKELERVTVWMADGSRRTLKLEEHWFHNGRVILKFEGYDDRTAAQFLVGGQLVVPGGQGRVLAENEFYEYSIIGAEVLTIEGGRLGRVTSVMRTGGTDLLVVRAEDGREHLIPFVDEICGEVDVIAGRITVNPPAGLLEL